MWRIRVSIGFAESELSEHLPPPEVFAAMEWWATPGFLGLYICATSKQVSIAGVKLQL